jgi:diketogulonate reductase-like aldo/keto reductase
VPLVKSVDYTRIVSNADLFDFELDPAEVTELDQLDECAYLSYIFLASWVSLFTTIAGDKTY